MSVSKLDILEVRSLERQGALFVLWPQYQSDFFSYFLDMATPIKSVIGGHQVILMYDLAYLKIINYKCPGLCEST